MSTLAEERVAIESRMSDMIADYNDRLKAKMQQWAEEEERARAAKAHGDLRENAEYQIARDNCARYSMEAANLMNVINTYNQYSAKYVPTGRVQIGSVVRLLDVELQEERVVKIYPEGLGNAKLGAIAVTSPVGTAVVDKLPGTTVIAHAPIGDLTYEIKEVD